MNLRKLFLRLNNTKYYMWLIRRYFKKTYGRNLDLEAVENSEHFQAMATEHARLVCSVFYPRAKSKLFNQIKRSFRDSVILETEL